MSTRTAPVQYCLFGPQTTEDLSQLLLLEAELIASAQAPNTQKAYAGAWKLFVDWCQDWGSAPIPTTPDVVGKFITWGALMRDPPYKPASLRLCVSAINRVHREAGQPAPINQSVRDIVAGVTRKAARQGARTEFAGNKHLTVAHLRKICGSLGTEMIDLRDRALILVGFASALRRSDVARPNTSNVEFEEGGLRLWVPFSKTDQIGAGRTIHLMPAKDPALCPVRAVDEWKKARLAYFGSFRGPLFLGFSHLRTPSERGLSAQGICRTVERRLDCVGEDARDYGAHSMRSGMITAADSAGATLRAIMDRTGHRSLQTVMRYIKSTRSANPLSDVL